MKKLLFLLLMVMIFIFSFSQNYDDYRIFILDKDQGTSFTDPYTLKETEYDFYWVQALNGLGFSADNKNLQIDNKLPPVNELLSYAVTIVECGHLPATENLLDLEEFEILSNYIDSGGCVYMEGNNLAEYIRNVDMQEKFLIPYFNLVLYDPGSGYSYYDTVKTDTTNTFFHDFSFLYPSGTDPDLENDIVVAYKPDDPAWQSVVIANSKEGKLYKTTASAYAPPVEKFGKASSKGRTYYSTIDMGAFYVVTRQKDDKYLVPDSIAARLERTAYVRDILRYFGIGLTLIVNDADDPDNIIAKIIETMNKVDFDNIIVKPGVDGPDFDFLLKYESIIWYTGLQTEATITKTDRDNLITYMDFGGNLLLSGENIAEEWGVRGQGETDDTFLYYYMGVDYIDPVLGDKEHVSDVNGEFYKYIPNEPLAMRQINSPDIIYPASTLKEAKPAFVFRSTLKSPSYSGVSYNAGPHNAVFLSFPLEQEVDADNIDALLQRTFDLFGYDFTFTPNDITTSSNNINISYTKYYTYIIFQLNLENPKTGKIELYNSNILENSINTNINEKTYKIPSKTNSGIFNIIYKDNKGKTLFTKKIKLLPINTDNDGIYIKNNTLYIKTDNNAEVNIYDITGKLQYTRSIHVGTNTIEHFKNLKSGIYFIKIGNSIEKILKY